jgi:hypothetical protein
VDDFLDTEVAAIKAKTDQLAFTTGRVHADIKAVNAVVLQGAGTALDKMRPA